MYGTPTDPIPYIAAAYGIGIFILVFYSVWQIRTRKKLRALESAIHETGAPS
ncbi:MAG: hypothetical protein V4655_04720 [Bdellovibrionota bacterium]